MKCPHCHKPISDEALRKGWGARSVSKRKKAVGPPKVMRTCPKCGGQFGTRELREHKPMCGGK